MAPDEQIYLVEIFAESGLDRWCVIDSYALTDMIESAASEHDLDRFNVWSLEDGQKPKMLDVTALIEEEIDLTSSDSAHARWYSSPGTSGRI